MAVEGQETMPFLARQETVVEAAVAEAPRIAAHWGQVEPEPQARATAAELRRVLDGERAVVVARAR
ncbi:hypothetical protein D4Q85_00350 [bacterium]|nr:MAG: hypothetical protein D4Q85_00350 [bacterium]